jgi:UPF0755 protein
MVFGVIFAVAAGIFYWRAMTTPFGDYPEPKRVEIRKGIHSRSITRLLQREGVLRDDFVPLIYLKTIRRGASLKAGVYEFREPMSPVAVLDKIIRGDVIQKSVTIREGLDRFAIAEIMIDEGFGTREQWEDATSSSEIIQDMAPDATSLEGYLFPDTYRLIPGTSPKAIAAEMVQNFRKQFGEELAFLSNGLSLHQTVTLASIVETEARLDAERNVVASVYLNRHRRGMPLQADPTVIYSMKLRGTWDGNIRKADLTFDHPYNTYRVRGFPPGPIANAGLQSLKASAHPARTDYLYFVSRNDGSHVFARTLAEHNQNVLVYQKRRSSRNRPVNLPASPPATATR